MTHAGAAYWALPPVSGDWGAPSQTDRLPLPGRNEETQGTYSMMLTRRHVETARPDGPAS